MANKSNLPTPSPLTLQSSDSGFCADPAGTLRYVYNQTSFGSGERPMILSANLAAPMQGGRRALDPRPEIRTCGICPGELCVGDALARIGHSFQA